MTPDQGRFIPKDVADAHSRSDPKGFAVRDPHEELLARIDTFVAEHREPYSIADAMRVVGRAKSARPPVHLRPRIREILVEDGVTTFFHPEIAEGTLRKICLTVGLPDPRISQASKRYWQERGTEERPGLSEEEREALRARKGKQMLPQEPSPEDAEKVQMIIEDVLQNSGRETPEELVTGFRTFFENNPREHYLLSDILEAMGRTRNGSADLIKRITKMVEDQGIVRAWKTAPLLIPLHVAIAACLEAGSLQGKRRRKPGLAATRNERKERTSNVLLSDAEIEQFTQGDDTLKLWLKEHKKGKYGLTDVANALGHKGGGSSQRVVVLAREAAKQHGISVDRQHVFLTPQIFIEIYKEVQENLLKREVATRAERTLPIQVFPREPKKGGRPKLTETAKEKRRREKEEQKEAVQQINIEEPIQVFPEAVVAERELPQAQKPVSSHNAGDFVIGLKVQRFNANEGDTGVIAGTELIDNQLYIVINFPPKDSLSPGSAFTTKIPMDKFDNVYRFC